MGLNDTEKNNQETLQRKLEVFIYAAHQGEEDLSRIFSPFLLPGRKPHQNQTNTHKKEPSWGHSFRESIIHHGGSQSIK